MNKLFTLISLLFLILYGCRSEKKEVDLKIIPVKSGNYWGYINHEGKYLINPQFQFASIFKEGLALVLSSDNKFGFINEDGKYVINPIYSDALSFSEELALVGKKDSQLEFIDNQGKTVITISPEIETASSFSEGLALVYSNGLYGYVDKTGKLVIPYTFNTASNFEEGFAKVGLKEKESNTFKYGFINKKGEVVINFQFVMANNFSDGLALVYNGSQYGYIDYEGKFVINPQFVEAYNFQGEYAVIKQGQLYGYIDKDGKIVINPQFFSAGQFLDNGLSSVKLTDGKVGYINKDGKIVIPSQFDAASGFYGDIALVVINSKIGIINKEGKIIVNPQFDEYAATDIRTTIASDFFDIKGLSSFILKDINRKNFIGFSATTTYDEVQKKYPYLNTNNYGELKDFERINNKYAELEMISFDFLGGVLNYSDEYVTEQVYDPVAGGYTSQKVYAGSKEVTNGKAILNGIELTFDLHKTKGKEIDIINEIANQLRKEYGFNDVSIEHHDGKTLKLKNENYSIILDLFDTKKDLRVYASFTDK